MKQIDLNNQTIHGAISLEQKGEYIKPWRINYEEKDFFTPNQLNGQAEVPAGVRISCVSNTDNIKLEIESNSYDIEFDIVIDDLLFDTFTLEKNNPYLVVFTK